MNPFVTLGVLAALFLALPWLAIAFKQYCDTVNRLANRRIQRARGIPYTPPVDDAVCNAYQPPTMPADSGLCARCGMYDYKHQEQP